MMARRLILAIGAVLLIAGNIFAQSGGGFTLTTWTVDGGGGRSTGGAYILSGTVGQPDSGMSQTGGGYTLRGGFWRPIRLIPPSPANAVPQRNYYTTGTVTLGWNAVTWAAGYEVQVSRNNTFTDLAYHNPNTAALAVTPTLADGAYFWRVRGLRSGGAPGAWSAVDTFTIDTQ